MNTPDDILNMVATEVATSGALAAAPCSAPRIVKCRGTRYDHYLNQNMPHEWDMIIWAQCGAYWLVSAVGDRGSPRVEHVEILQRVVVELQNDSSAPTAGDGTKDHE